MEGNSAADVVCKKQLQFPDFIPHHTPTTPQHIAALQTLAGWDLPAAAQQRFWPWFALFGPVLASKASFPQV